jgi:hypothetical protein
MNNNEVTANMAIMKTAYPAFYKDMADEEIDNVISLWTMMFESDNAKIVTEAVKSLVCTLKFPPTIADVKGKIALLTQSKSSSELEAWGLVLKAIGNANYQAKEMFERLPEICQKLVGSPNHLREWAMMDSEIVNSVIQSNFMRSYKSRVAQEKEYNMLPDSAKQTMKNLSEGTNRMYLMAGDEDA